MGPTLTKVPNPTMVKLNEWFNVCFDEWLTESLFMIVADLCGESLLKKWLQNTVTVFGTLCWHHPHGFAA